MANAGGDELKISDEEIQAAIEAWFDGDAPARDYSKDMRKVLKAALRIRKQRKQQKIQASNIAREYSS